MNLVIKDTEGRLGEGSKVQLFVDDVEVNLAIREVGTVSRVVKPHLYSKQKLVHGGSREQEVTVTLEETL